MSPRFLGLPLQAVRLLASSESSDPALLIGFAVLMAGDAAVIDTLAALESVFGFGVKRMNRPLEYAADTSTANRIVPANVSASWISVNVG